MSEPLLSVRDLRVVFKMATGKIEALHGVDFDIQPGSTVALVGESASGKSVTAQAVMGILPANARITSGQLVFNDPASGVSTDIASLPADSSQLQDILAARAGDQLGVVAMDNYGTADLFSRSWNWSNDQVIESLPGSDWQGESFSDPKWRGKGTRIFWRRR